MNKRTENQKLKISEELVERINKIKAELNCLEYELKQREEPIRLLTAEEYDWYKDKIPELNCSWWLRDPAYSGAVKAIDNDKSRTWYYPGVNLSPPAVRPVIDVSGMDLLHMKFYDGMGTMVHCGITWKLLKDTLYIAELPIGFRRFDPESSDYDKSEIKKWLEKWYEERKDI